MKGIFKRDTTIHIRWVSLLCVSCLCMMLQSRYMNTPLWAGVQGGLVMPLRYVVDAPSRAWYAVQSHWLFDRHLQQQRDHLQQENALLRARLAQLAWLQDETRDVKNLSDAVSQWPSGQHASVVSLLHVKQSPTRQRLTIAAGTHDGVQVGQAVMDAQGVMGQVVAVYGHAAEVLLITDPQSGVPIQNRRNRLRAIATGDGSRFLRLSHVAASLDFKVGDVLLTSGLGERFPAGYAVGVITAVQPSEDRHFKVVVVHPSAKLDRGRHVVLLSPHATMHANKRVGWQVGQKDDLSQGGV